MDKKLVIDYMASLACLYGIVRKRQVVKIYNRQNQDQISLDDVEAIIQKSV